MTSMFVNIIDICRICSTDVTKVEPQRLFWQAETQQFQRAHFNCVKKTCTRARNFTTLAGPVEHGEDGCLAFPNPKGKSSLWDRYILDDKE